MILVTGGTGFVGSRLVPDLLAQGHSVRLLSHGNVDWTDTTVSELKKAGVDVVVGDIRDPRRVLSAVEGAKVVINLVGILKQSGENTFQGVHVEATKNLVDTALKYGVERFIHVSCLGASEFSDNECFKTKWQAEEIVRSADFFWTIFRPSLIFAEDSDFLNKLTSMVKQMPVIPVIDSGLNRLAPVSVEDVATCITQCVYNKHTANKTYDLTGPSSYSISEFLSLISAALGKAKPVVHVPSSMAKTVAGLVAKIKPDSAFNADLVNLLKSDSIGDRDQMLATFAIQWTSFEDCLAKLANT